jgi:hypothetical protein
MLMDEIRKQLGVAEAAAGLLRSAADAMWVNAMKQMAETNATDTRRMDAPILNETPNDRIPLKGVGRNTIRTGHR